MSDVAFVREDMLQEQAPTVEAVDYPSNMR